MPPCPRPTPERRTAQQLVYDGMPQNFKTQWYRRLSKINQLYVNEIIQEILKNPEASLQLVARNLAVELSIKPTEIPVIATTLEEIIRDVKKATQ